MLIPLRKNHKQRKGTKSKEHKHLYSDHWTRTRTEITKRVEKDQRTVVERQW